ncbi:g4785 [Coccomyxa elongata]
MGDVKLDEEVFCGHLQSFYNSWNEGGQGWGQDDQQATAVVIPSGAASGEELRYLKSTSMQLWFFGYELPETVLLFTKEALHVVTAGKKAKLIGALAAACKEKVGVELIMHEKPKGEDGSTQINELLEAVKASAESPVLGALQKESKQEGKLAELWSKAVEGAAVKQVDVAAALSELLATKDAGDIQKAKKAAFLAASAMKTFAVQELERIIDEEKKVKHTKFGQKIEEVITDPSKINVKLKADMVDISYPPIVQSGGVYDLKAGASNDERPLQYDVVLMAIGTRYNLFCANLARTFLVDPSKAQQDEYTALLAAAEAATKALVPGAPCSDAYSAAVKALEDANQGHLVAKLPKNIGWSMGTELRESHYQLSAKCAATVKPGMIFNVSIGVSGLERSDPGEGQAKAYALLVADTYLVPPEEGKPAECLTSLAPKKWVDVAYYFKENEEEDEKQAVPKAPNDRDVFAGNKNLRSEDNKFRERDQERRKQKENQEDLLRSANENTLKALKASEAGSSGVAAGRKASALESYKSIDEVPSTRELAIQVDQKNESLLVPIYGLMVPFHILTVKNVSNNQDGDHAYIRLNFNFGPTFEPGMKFPQATFLKELSYRTSDTRHATKVVQEIKVLRSSVSQREKERAERATLVQQERLIKAKGRVYTLNDVWIRPAFGGKGRKMTGQLEAHANGFRYSTPKGETLDIMYTNIRHAFFQPAESEMMTLLHFHLHNPIMVGKKKAVDVQFYTEVMESVQTIDAGRRSMYDPDELEEEQRERDTKNRINKTFHSFMKHVQQDVWERDHGDLQLEFEVPFRELGFSGVPHRTTGFIMPTVNCLVELIEMPFTVVTLADINVVNLERVGFGLRNFDMAIVPKDLTKDVVRIDVIPQQSLDTIRDWLTSMNIKYYESKMNLNWKPILKSITDDPEGFVESGGWDFLDAEGGDDDEEGEDSEEEDEFKPDSEEEEEAESEDDEDDSDVDEDEDEDDEEEEYSEEDEEEEGMSWEELEKEAIREDRKRNAEEEDDEPKKKSKKARR